jgi:hypothetical protein
MKKYIILLSALVFTMCTTPKSRLYEVELKQADQAKTGIRYDTIFMDFKYGMSQHKTFERFRDLVYLEYLTITKGGAFEWQTKLDTFKLGVGFHSNYYHDSLYSFSFIYKGKNQSQADRMQLFLADSLKSKYGEPVIIPSEEDTTKRDYFFVKGNQRIDLIYPFQSKKTIATYTDFTIENRKNLEELQEANKPKSVKKEMEKE